MPLSPGISSRVLKDPTTGQERRVAVGSDAEKKYLGQGYQAQSEGATSSKTGEAKPTRYTAPETGGGTGTSGSRYTSDADAAFREGGALGVRTPYTPQEERNLRDEELRRVQAQIDAINEAGDYELDLARERAAGRMGQSRALSSATGTLGSPIGTTRDEQISGKNREEQAAIKNATALKVQNIFKAVDEKVQKLADARKTEAVNNTEKFLEYQKGLATDAKADMKELATAGIELSGSQRASLMELTGYDGDTFDSLYKSIQIANGNNYLNKDKPQIVGNTAVYFKQVTDPETGETRIETEEVKLPDAFGKQVDQTVARDDGIYVFYKDGTWAKVGQAKGPTATEKTAADKAATAKTSAAARATEVKALVTELTDPSVRGLIDNITGIGVGSIAANLPGSPEQEIKNKVERLKGLLALDSIKDFKGLGALSDREFGTASAAATSLGYNLGDQAFVDEIARIGKNMDKILGSGEVEGNGATGDEVLMMDANGQQGYVPKDQVDDALAEGYSLVQ